MTYEAASIFSGFPHLYWKDYTSNKLLVPWLSGWLLYLCLPLCSSENKCAVAKDTTIRHLKALLGLLWQEPDTKPSRLSSTRLSANVKDSCKNWKTEIQQWSKLPRRRGISSLLLFHPSLFLTSALRDD